MLQQLIFLLVFGLGAGFAAHNFLKVRRNILLGKPEPLEGPSGRRWRNVLLVAFGQRKMFKRWIPAIFHFFLYVAFLFTQIELIEIIVDGLAGQHRIFAGSLGVVYPAIIGSIEFLSVLAFVATVIFLWRRNVRKVDRLHKPEMRGWPSLDGNLILIFEILLLIGIFCMNGADVLLQELSPAKYPDTGPLVVSSWLGPRLFGGLSEPALVGVERFGWWLHLSMVLVFLNYLPFSKHLHIFLAFPNTYFARLKPAGAMDNMPEVMQEVRSMLGLDQDGGEALPLDEDIPEFGARDVFDLPRTTLLGAYSCTECGRCTAECPANITGKKLSPRKIMMDIRDRAVEVGKKLDSGDSQYARDNQKPLSPDNFDDGRSLFDLISREELHACTTCNACVEACPVLINPLQPILQMRRYEILTESAGPSEWLPLFNSLENAGSAWAMSQARDAWKDKLDA